MRDDTFMGPGKQRISERSLWWTVKRKDTANAH
jgi:DNA-binding protein HU-beta